MLTTVITHVAGERDTALNTSEATRLSLVAKMTSAEEELARVNSAATTWKAKHDELMRQRAAINPRELEQLRQVRCPGFDYSIVIVRAVAARRASSCVLAAANSIALSASAVHLSRKKRIEALIIWYDC